MTSGHDDLDGLVWSWVEHVRSRGTTPWAQWASIGRPVDAVPDRPVPGAAQLEVVRRLAERNAAGEGPNVDFIRLADLVLDRSGPGRGLADLPLADLRLAALGARLEDRVGAPPVDPAEVPLAELIRVCVGTFCDLITERPQQTGCEQPRRRLWSKQFHLAGAPVSTASLRAALATSGHVEFGRKPKVIVVVAAFEEMMQQVWTARVQRGSGLRWGRFVANWARQDRLPISANPSVIAAHWASRVGAARVHVVVSEHDDAADRRTAAKILGIPVPQAAQPAAAEVAALGAASGDVLRRVNAVLKVRVEPGAHRALLRQAAGHLMVSGERLSLSVGEKYADWARERSEQMAEQLAAGGYSVHGDLQQIVSRRGGEGRRSPDRDDVLDIALRACLRAAEQ